MTNKINTILITAILGSALLFNTQAAEAAPSFYKCDSGYKFKINRRKTGARCEKTTRDIVKPISCPQILGVGTFPHAKSGKDRCAGRGLFTIEASHDPLACASGYSYKKNYQGNKDKCVKKGRLTIKPPTKKFR